MLVRAYANDTIISIGTRGIKGTPILPKGKDYFCLTKYKPVEQVDTLYNISQVAANNFYIPSTFTVSKLNDESGKFRLSYMNPSEKILFDNRNDVEHYINSSSLPKDGKITMSVDNVSVLFLGEENNKIDAYIITKLELDKRFATLFSADARHIQIPTEPNVFTTSYAK